jgi:hypothetical protein
MNRAEREAHQQMRSMFRLAAERGATKQLLVEYGVPESFLAAVLDSAQKLHRLYTSGSHQEARAFADQLAGAAVSTFGAELGAVQDTDPRELAQRIFEHGWGG